MLRVGITLKNVSKNTRCQLYSGLKLSDNIFNINNITNSQQTQIVKKSPRADFWLFLHLRSCPKVSPFDMTPRPLLLTILTKLLPATLLPPPLQPLISHLPYYL